VPRGEAEGIEIVAVIGGIHVREARDRRRQSLVTVGVGVARTMGHALSRAIRHLCRSRGGRNEEQA
jgi:hypothetical protein